MTSLFHFEFVKEQLLKDFSEGQVIKFSDTKGNGIVERINKNALELKEFTTVKAGLKAYETGKGIPKQTDKMKKDRVYHTTKRKDKSYRIYLEGKRRLQVFHKVAF